MSSSTNNKSVNLECQLVSISHPQQEQRLTNNEPIQLKRQIGLWSGVSIIVGIIVGSGIFVTPQDVIRESGSEGAALIVWALSGAISTMGALSFAELGASISTSGGDYSYIHLAYGPLTAFLYLWVIVLIIVPCGNAIAALTFAKYTIKIFSSLTTTILNDGTVFNCEPNDMATRCLAFALLLLLLYINCRSVEYSIKIQSVFTLAKVFALGVVICVGLYYIAAGKGTNLLYRTDLFKDTTDSIPSLTLAFYAAIYTFSGWNSLNFITEEMKNPVQNMSKAIYLSLSLVTIIYILANIAYCAVLTKAEILSSDTIASTFASKVFSGGFEWFMPLAVSLSATSGLNGFLFAASRILFVGARQGQLFNLLNAVHIKHLTPVPSLIFLGFLSTIYLISTNISNLINYSMFLEAGFSALAVSTVIALRKQFPNISRPIRVNLLVPYTYLLASIILVILPIWERPLNALVGTGILLTGIPVYYLTAAWKNKPKSYQGAIDKINLYAQKLTMSVIPEPDMQL